MGWSNCSAPIPPGDITFFCCPGVLITLIFTCPALYNHQNHPFFECPALFYHTHIFSYPGAARGGGVGAEQFDRRIISFKDCKNSFEISLCIFQCLNYLVHNFWHYYKAANLPNFKVIQKLNG